MKEKGKNKKKKRLEIIFYVICGIILTYSVTVITLHIAFGLYSVEGISMYPTFKGDGSERVFSSKKRVPKIGDIVTIETDQGNIIKRVIAGPGDVVNVKDGIIYVNGEPTPYQREKLVGTYKFLNETGYIIEEGKYYCLGDNLNNSGDSKYYGSYDRNKMRVVTKCIRAPFKMPKWLF